MMLLGITTYHINHCEKFGVLNNTLKLNTLLAYTSLFGLVFFSNRLFAYYV
jgi:hypothetical protein